jgi:hypothetical protein
MRALFVPARLAVGPRSSLDNERKYDFGLNEARDLD